MRYVNLILMVLAVLALLPAVVCDTSDATGSTVEADVSAAEIYSMDVNDGDDVPSSPELDTVAFVYEKGSEKEKLFKQIVKDRDTVTPLPKSDSYSSSQDYVLYWFSTDGPGGMGMSDAYINSHWFHVLVDRDTFLYRMYGIDETEITVTKGVVGIEDFHDSSLSGYLTPGSPIVLDVSELNDIRNGPAILLYGYFDEDKVTEGYMTATQAAFVSIGFTVSDYYDLGEEGSGGYTLGIALATVGVVALALKFALKVKPGWSRKKD